MPILKGFTNSFYFTLLSFFQNMFVLPNMEDLPIKIMNSGLEEDFPEW